MARKRRRQEALRRQFHGPTWPRFYCDACDQQMATVRGFQGDTPVAWCRACLPADWQRHVLPITDLRGRNGTR